MPKSTLDRFKERKIAQWAIVYSAAAWLLLQVLEVVAGPWHIPDGVVRLIQSVLALGFLITLVLAWYHGERGRQRISGVELMILAALLAIGAIMVSVVLPDHAPLTDEPVGGDQLATIRPVQAASIAVLPFLDLSPEGDQAYFGDGIAEEILNGLSKVAGLKVAARTSAFQLRHEEIPVIGNRLGVETVLEGSVRKEGERVIITVQLINASDGFQVWSQRFEPAMASVIDTQEQIARSVASALELRLMDDGSRLMSAETDNPVAHERYLMGRYFWNQRTPGGFLRALELFEEAISLDPDFALGHTGVADAYVLLFEYSMMPPATALPRARAAAERALELDPTLAEAAASLGEVLAASREWVGAQDAFQRSLRLNPGYLTGQHWYGWFLTHLGRIEEGIERLKYAKELDPLSGVVRRDLAGAYLADSRFEEAIAEAEQCVEDISIHCGNMQWVWTRALEMSGQPGEAMRVARNDSFPGVNDIRILARQGRVQEARALLDSATASASPAELANPIQYLFYAETWVALGEMEAALDAIETAVALGLSVGPIQIRRWPLFEPLWEHPRYRAAVAELGLDTIR
jgi:TolB-like protein